MRCVYQFARLERRHCVQLDAPQRMDAAPPAKTAGHNITRLIVRQPPFQDTRATLDARNQERLCLVLQGTLNVTTQGPPASPLTATLPLPILAMSSNMAWITAAVES